MPSPIAFPPGPSWVLVNADQPLSLPVLGQFDPELRVQKGRPKWQSKDGIAGGMPWLKYTGRSWVLYVCISRDLTDNVRPVPVVGMGTYQ